MDKLVDKSLNGDFDVEEALRFFKIGLLCTQDIPKLQPSMSTVVKMLTGERDADAFEITKPGLISDFMDLKVKSNTEPEPDEPNTINTTTSGSNFQDRSSLSSGTASQATMTFTATWDRTNEQVIS